MSKPIAIGMCTSPDQVAKLAPGYDHLELAVSATLMPLEEDTAFAPQDARLRELRPRIRAFNVFVPKEVRLVGQDVNWEQVETYVRRALHRAANLGGDIVVFGSGGARSTPEGFSRALAWGQLVRFLSLCAEFAQIEGITIAIEPLNRTESNILNSYPEAVQMAKDVGRSQVRVLADIYHFVMESEPLEDIANDPAWLAHVHLADTGRLYPGSGVYPLERLFAILKDVGYQGMASVECKWSDDFASESAKALQFVRGLAE